MVQLQKKINMNIQNEFELNSTPKNALIKTLNNFSLHIDN